MSYRYIGNKTKLLSKLLPYIEKYVKEGDTIVDLMCGTASVAEALKLNNYKVIACDMMTYSIHHARIRLLAKEEPSFSQLEFNTYQDVLDYLNTLNEIKGHFFIEYSPQGSPKNGSAPRKYFTSENASKIDAINTQINQWKSMRLINDLEESFLRHDLILATNKIANIAGTYGHFRSKWNNSSLSKLKLKKANFVKIDNDIEHLVLKGTAEELSHKITADLCYIDPPYMKRQYAANYHILETLARGDSPDAVGISGLRPWRDQYSNFCSKRKIQESFLKILKDMHCNQFLISYSEDGLLKKDELTTLFSKIGKVDFFEIEYQRFKSNHSVLKKDIKEYLFYISKY